MENKETLAEKIEKELELWERRNPYWEDEDKGQQAIAELRVLIRTNFKDVKDKIQEFIREVKEQMIYTSQATENFNKDLIDKLALEKFGKEIVE